MEFLLIFLITVVAGIFSGMGIGGGTILVVGITMFLNKAQLFAQGVNVLTFIPVALVAVIVHIKNNNIDFKNITWFLPFGVLGTFLGSMVAFYIDDKYLKYGFGGFILVFGIVTVIKGIKGLIKKRKG
ncbi:MAG: sulfite exporter TauE/SafE family protein [Clostridia bacterium]|nr:sulfite exporter TauE/SafE family protein [Clostridia bacterium]